MTISPLFYLFIFLFAAFFQPSAQAQQPDDKKPMYGEVAKSEEYKKLDEQFIISTTILNGGSKIKSSEAFNKKAWYYLYHDSLDLAMKKFNQAWLLLPENPETYFGFGAILELRKDHAGAERMYHLGNSQLKEGDKVEVYYQKVADCQEKLLDINGAVATYEKMVLANPAYVHAYKKLGYFYMQSGDQKRAILNYNKALELDSKDAVTFSNRAYLFQTMKKYSNALADYSHAISIDNTYISAFLNRGITWMKTGDHEGAKRDFETCVQLNGTSGELRRHLGMAKLHLKDKTGACKDFVIAKGLGDVQVLPLISKHCK